ncbi:MAG: hypothetical protein IJ498_01515 [Akkermansia sp.]|nr:hypothetical protein [Akkermansia sp.]
MTSMNKPLSTGDYASKRSISVENCRSGEAKETQSQEESLNATHTIRVELPPEDYAVLARRAALEGGSPEALVAQAVGNLLQ